MEEISAATAEKSIFVTTHRVWEILDFAEQPSKRYVLQPGRYELERIRHPHGRDCFCLVLKGTKIGAAQGFWRDWSEDELDDPSFRIDIEEIGS